MPHATPHTRLLRPARSKEGGNTLGGQNGPFGGQNGPGSGTRRPFCRPSSLLLKLGGALVLGATGFTFGVPGIAEAQVAISVGVQEIYDDNIFLEDDEGLPPPVVFDSDLVEPGFVLDPPEQADGDPDDDFLTNVYLSLNGTIPISPSIRTSAEGRVGGIFFADHDDESRLTLDTTLRITPEEILLPKPYVAAVQSKIESRANDITSATGTATKQTQQHIASLDLGVSNVELSASSRFSMLYQFSYTNFLGDFTFKERDSEELGEFNDRFDEKGSDFFTNTLSSTVDYDVTNDWVAGVYAGVTDRTFTNVESNDLVPKDEEDQDRVEGNAGVKTQYLISKEVKVGGLVGISLARFKEEREPQELTVVNPDGTTTQILREVDRNQEGLEFAADVTYTPDVTRSLVARVQQGVTADVDGDRLITRTVALNGVQAIGDRFRLNLGGLFVQYNIGDSLNNPTERFEVTAGASYALTQSLSLNAGWNYTVQDADEENIEESVLFNSEDYEAHRFFIGLEAGLVGLTKS